MEVYGCKIRIAELFPSMLITVAVVVLGQIMALLISFNNDFLKLTQNSLKLFKCATESMTTVPKAEAELNAEAGKQFCSDDKLELPCQKRNSCMRQVALRLPTTN